MLQVTEPQTFMDTYRHYYEAIINYVAEDLLRGNYSNLDLDLYALSFNQIINGMLPVQLDHDVLGFRWLIVNQINNPIFKILVETFDTLSVLKILYFQYNRFNFNRIDTIENPFVIDTRLNIILIGDHIVAGYLLIFKVLGITKSSNLKVATGPFNNSKYKYYSPRDVLKHSVI